MVRALPAFLLALASLFWACSDDSGTDSPSQGLRVDSIVVDLFSLKADLMVRFEGAELTPLGQSLLVELDSNVVVDNNVILRTGLKVRAYSAYFLREHDLHCGCFYQGDSAFILEFDDGIPGSCHDTLLAQVPAYPYRQPVDVNFLEGKGFWLYGWQVVSARGKLKILFDYFP